MILESVLKESEKDPKETMEIEQEIEKETAYDTQHNIENIHLCMKRISHDAASSTSKLLLIQSKLLDTKVLSSLTKIMPFLTGNQEEPSKTLISYFTNYLTFSSAAEGT